VIYTKGANMNTFFTNYNLLAAIIGFIGLLIQNVNIFIQDGKFKKKIAVLEIENKTIIKEDVQKKMEQVRKITEYEKKRAIAFEKNSKIVFIILIISFLFQLLGAL